VSVVGNAGSGKSITRWAWTQHSKYEERFSSAVALPTNRHLHFVRLRSRAEVEQWLSIIDSRR
jgi:ABC-type dipeptide/oligopeptide/nickel transport system ATPase component